MELKSYFAWDDQGNSLPGATCYLYMRGTESLITGLKQANGAPLNNPFTTDSSGRASFVAPNGIYDLRIAKGKRDYRIPVQSNDVSETVASAKDAAAQAEEARDAAQLAAGIYTRMEDALKIVVEGAYFNLPSPLETESLILYQKLNGIGVERKRYPATKALDAVLSTTNKLVDTVDAHNRVLTSGFSEKLAFALTDAAGHESWLGINRVDGGPSEWAEYMLRRLFGIHKSGRTGYAFALTDSVGRMTDFAIRDTDGQVDEFVIKRWAKRLVPHLGLAMNAGTFYANDTYLRDGELLPVFPNMQQIAGWGSSTIDEWAGELTAMAKGLGASYYNGGNGATELQHNLAQLGAVPAKLLPVGSSIPASGSVQVTCSNVKPNAAFRATVGSLAGVEGTLSSTANSWTFTRKSSGSAVAVNAEQPFLPTQGLAHRADFTLMQQGKNDLNEGYALEEIIARHTKCFDWLSPMVKRVIVMTHFGSTGNTNPDHTARVKALNAHIFQRYGNQVFDLAAYLASAQVWTDTGFTPTQEDLANQAAGCLPATLSRDNWAHMNATTRTAAAARLKSFILSLKWY